MSLLDLFITLHVAGAVCWVGGGTLAHVQSSIVFRGTNQERTAGMVETMAALGPRFFIPAELLTIVFGIATLIKAEIAFGQLWVIAGLSIFIISMAIGGAIFGPSFERLVKLDESGEHGSTEYNELLARLMTIMRVDMLLLWAAVAFMVIRPG